MKSIIGRNGMALAGLLLAGTVLLGAGGCKKPAGGPAGPVAEQTGPIRVGEFASLTGNEATFGQSSHNGTMMAIEELNAKGGVLGRPFELVSEDNQSKAGESATIAKKLLSGKGVVALLGEVASSRSLEVAPIAQEQQVPMISPASTNPKVTATGDYVFRICFIDPFQGTVMSKFALNSLKVQNVAVLTDVKSDYSVGLADYFKKHFLDNGGEIVSEQKYSGGDKDFKAQLTAIKAANPDAIFIPGYYTEVGLIAQQARQLDITVPLMGGDGWDSAVTTEIGGAAVEGCYFSNHYSAEDESPEVQNFVTVYKEKYGVVPDAMGALGYDTAMLLADAIKRAGTTEAKALRAALADTKEFPGVTGKITMDQNRDATKPAVILKIDQGKFTYLETVYP